MAGPNPVVVKIGADTSQLKAGLNQAGSALNEMKQGMGRARESAMFFTQALGEFGPQGRTAQIALSGIAGAIMGGGGVLLALSLAQAGVRLLVDAWEEEAKAAEKAAKEREAAAEKEAAATTRSLRVVGDARDSVREANRRLKGELAGLTDAEVEHREEVSRLKAEMVGLHGAKLRTAQLRLDEIQNLAAENERLRQQIEYKKLLKELDKGPGEASLGNAVDFVEMKATADAAKGLSETLDRLAKEVVSGTWAVAVPKMDDDIYNSMVAMEKWKTAIGEVQGALESAGREMANSFAQSFSPMLTQAASFTDAMEEAGGAAETMGDTSGAAYAKMAQDALAALAVEAASRAIFEGAMALASLAVDNYKAAAQHGAAAAAFGVVAGVAGGAAYAIGQNRGMTASEKQQVEAARNANQSSLGSSSITGSDSEITKRETVYVIAPGGFTEAEIARVTARSIAAAERLGYMRGAEAT